MKRTNIVRGGLIVIGFVSLQACTQMASSNLQSEDNLAFRPEQIKLQRESATADFNARVETQRQEILNWQQVWQEKLDRLEAERKASLGEAKASVSQSVITKAVVTKAEVIEPVITKAEVIEPDVTKSNQTAQKTAKPVTPAKRKVVVKNARSKYDRLIAKYAGEYGVPIKLAHAIVKIESSYRADARGSRGEIGLMQVRLSTAKGMGYSGGAKELYYPETNLKYGMKYLGKAFKLGGGSTCGAILKYNAGHSAKRMNATSAKYCEKVKAYI